MAPGGDKIALLSRIHSTRAAHRYSVLKIGRYQRYNSVNVGPFIPMFTWSRGLPSVAVRFLLRPAFAVLRLRFTVCVCGFCGHAVGWSPGIATGHAVPWVGGGPTGYAPNCRSRWRQQTSRADGLAAARTAASTDDG